MHYAGLKGLNQHIAFAHQPSTLRGNANPAAGNVVPIADPEQDESFMTGLVVLTATGTEEVEQAAKRPRRSWEEEQGAGQAGQDLEDEEQRVMPPGITIQLRDKV